VKLLPGDFVQRNAACQHLVSDGVIMGQSREFMLPLAQQRIRTGVIIALQQITAAVTGIDDVGLVILHHHNNQRGAHPGHNRVSLRLGEYLPMGRMKRMYHQLKIVSSRGVHQVCP